MALRYPVAPSTLPAEASYAPATLTSATLRRHCDLVLKRAFDLALAVLGLLLILPVVLLVAAAIALEDGRPILHRAQRVGRDGRTFTMYKFRTMWRDAASRGPGITGANDPRVTRVGRLLRASKLDELPQLWNVLRGEMSVVGPRPEDPRYVSLYSPAERAVLSVRPGITGPAQVVFRDESSLLRPGHVHEDYVALVMPRKLAIDLQYVTAPSVWRDLGVLFGTARAIVAARQPALPSEAA